jgi:hypothetical protein
VIYALFVIELARTAMVEQTIIVYHAKLIVLFLELNAFVMMVN